MGDAWRDMILTIQLGYYISHCMAVYVELDGTGDGIESCSKVKEDKSPESSVIRKVQVILSRALSVLRWDRNCS